MGNTENLLITYLRVSTERQGIDGNGMEVQRRNCADYIAKNGGTHVAEYVETKSGGLRDRPQLLTAIDHAKEIKATLVVAKLDRLARDVEFTFSIFNSGIKIYICDMPDLNTLTLGIFATVSQYEREMIRGRVKSAVRIAKERGVKFGVANKEWKPTGFKNHRDLMIYASQKSAKAKKLRFKESEETIKFITFCKNLRIRTARECSLRWEELKEMGVMLKTREGEKRHLKDGKDAYQMYKRLEKLNLILIK